MPFRFNQRELVAIASKESNEFDKEGVLFLKEVEDKLFLRTERKLYLLAILCTYI